MTYASGKYARFVCDMCGFAYPYLDRQKTSYGTVVCPTCFDGDYDLKNHPQNKAPVISVDAEALEDMRPEVVVCIDTSWTPSLTIRTSLGV
jgi:hypothetical protein